ncbi:branched-chain amino acid ABC transporter ATP-binding protein/permease [Conexibacter sp. CPCC 206217]|uniref:branched-chain amino acid ABC transporter ATP-binding protein/permease n=1 Tax=Conexibacter sp. CPCC 206217 TaxID=3064574 RepID=UPI00272811D8|nr:branched-chain amino acid ABC transporter ATP-binding protein/permease [Conexibacter sp. CPCC 206217]MDO8211118.1 branched-chain amino acid ABC transporter ATP-binding protein/permease [Conexibacter sp. CPCC 206217]
MSPYTLGIITQVLLFGAIASSYNLLLGFSRLFSVAQGAFVSFGAYAIGIGAIRYDLPWLVAAIAGIALAGVAGLMIGLLALRISDDYLAIATFALQIVMTSALESFHDFTGGTYGIPGIPGIEIFGFAFDTPWDLVFAAAIVLVICMEAARRVDRSPFGLVLRASGQDEVAARALGKRPALAKVAVVTVSAMLAAVAGAVYASYLGYILPATFDVHFSILLLSMVIVGGAGSMLGPLVGSILIVALPELLDQLGATSSTVVYIRELLFGVVLLLVVVVLRRGIVKPRRHAQPAPHDVGGEIVHVSGATLEGRGLTRAFGGIKAVTDVDLSLAPGRVTGVVGPNGAGKTTLFDLVTGAQPANAGTVALDASTIDKLGFDARARHGLLRSFQGLRLFEELTALENVMVAVPLGHDEGAVTALLRRRRARAALRRAAQEAGAALGAVGLTEGLDRRARDLSYAEQKLLSLARVIAAKPRVVLLDEPASGLDPATLARMTEIVRGLAQDGRSVCIVEHNTKVLSELSDEMVFLHLGEVLATGSPEQITSDPRLAAIYFGVAEESAPKKTPEGVM